ncbi:N-acetyltransferase [archaeon]|nr:MAG: N-acetyltransferase [archaeon]
MERNTLKDTDSATLKIDLQQGFYLSPIVKTDKAAYLTHLADPYITSNLLVVPYPYTEEHADFWLDLRANDTFPYTFFAIRRSDGFLIGTIGTHIEKNNHILEFGYWLTSEYRGMSLMPVAIQVFCRYVFQHFPGAHRIQAGIFSFNDASGRALVKAGFTNESGILRHYYKKGDQFIDAIMYSLLSTDVMPVVEVKTRSEK